MSWENEPGLLRLPPEITVRILRSLLSSSEPLQEVEILHHWSCEIHCDSGHENCWMTKTGSNFKLFPEILQTCKRLHMEGIEILYGNTIRIHVVHDFTTYYMLLKESHDLLFNISLEFAGRFPEIEIAMHILWPLHLQFADEMHRLLFDATAWLCQSLSRLIDLGQKTLAIVVSNVYHLDEEENPLGDYDASQGPKGRDLQDLLPVLSPFQLIRCKSVEVFIKGKNVQPGWAKTMTSAESIVDLCDMEKCLLEFSVKRGFMTQERRAQIWKTLQAWDMEDFLRIGKELVEDIDKCFAESREACFAAG